MKLLTLNTEDGKNISANLFDKHIEKPKGFIVFTHMMPAVKESWNELAETFEDLGYVGIAIDLRGHGASSDGPDGYKKFNIEEHRAGRYDIDSAVKYISAIGAKKEEINFIGASIGANLSLEYFAKNDGRAVILLSPGINYADIKTVPLVHLLKESQSIMLVSSRDDWIEGNADGTQKLFDEIPENVSKKVIIYEDAHHGTMMLETKEEPDLKKSIIDFIETDNE